MRVIISSVCAAVMAASMAAHAQTVQLSAPLANALNYLDVTRAGVRVVAVGDRGNILFSDDEGETWQAAQTPTDALLTAVCFADARHGWAVGHDAIVLATEDGGQTWTQQYSDPLGGAADEEEDYAEEESYDDYDNYDDYDSYEDFDETAAAVDTSGAPFLDVHCESSERVIAVGGYGYVIETQDGGTSWQKRNADMQNPDGWHLYTIRRIPDTSTLLVAGEKGTLLRSRDNGVSWQKLQSPYGGTFFGMTVTDNLVLVHGMQGKVFASRDAGNTWREIRTGVTRAINDGVVLSDGTIILAGQSGAVLVSHDNGNSVALQYLRDRTTVSSFLPLTDDGLLIAGENGIHIVHGIR